MTNKDMAGILATIERLYPGHRKTEQERVEMVKVWASMFPDDDPAAVMNAVRAFALSDAGGFPPTVGQIKARMNVAPQMGELEAWGLVARACQNGYYHADEEFAKLPEDIQQTLGSPSQLRDWAMLDEATLHSVIASNFQRAYKVVQARRAELAALPANNQKLLGDKTDERQLLS